MYRKPIFIICFVLAFVLSNTAEAADPDLLLWWKFDEGTGTTAFDSSGNGRDGTLVGPPTWVSSLPGFGSALDFGGDGDHVIDADAAGYMNGLSALSVALWIKSDVIGTDSGFIIFENPVGQDKKNIRYDADGGGGDLNLFKYGVTTGNDVREEDESPSDLQSTDWQHVCVTWQNGTTAATFPNGLNFYLNGVLLAPEEDDGDFVANGVTSAYDRVMVGKGCKDEGASDGWDGIVDDVQIYSRKLTQEEILVIMAGREEGQAYAPNPEDGAIDVAVDANLSWIRGEGAVQDDVYFGTDPCALPKVTTIMNLPSFPPLYEPPSDLIASTTYYWRIDEVNGLRTVTGKVWSFTTVLGEAQPYFPFDGAMIPGDVTGDTIWTKLVFTPGATATKHTGYFNEDYSKVDSRAEDANLGQPPYASMPGWEYTFFAGNPQVPPADETLVRGTKYFWTVDAEDAEGNVFGGDIWEFAIQGFYAFSPNPPNEAQFISVTPLLSWLPGFGVTDHEIYMGTSWEDVNNAVYDYLAPPPEFVISRGEPNYQVVTALPDSTKIYWRVDESQGRSPPFFIATALYKGDVWCFTTIPVFGLDDPNLLGWWKFDMGYGIRAWDWSGHENHGTRVGDPPWVGGKTGDANDFALEFDGIDDYVDCGDVGTSGPVTIAAWVKWTGSGNQAIVSKVTGTSQKDYDISVDNGVLELWYESGTGDQWVYSTQPIPTDEWTHIAIAFDTLYSGRMYINAALDQSWDTTGNNRGPSTQPVNIGRRAGTYNSNYFSGTIDDVRIYDYALSGEEIRMLGAPPEAWSPKPYDGEASVAVTTALQWMPGKHAAQHDVYIGTDKATVTNATTSSTGIYKGRIGPNTLAVPLSAETLYYWRIDEVNISGPSPYLWKGDTWVFRTVGAAGGLLGLYYHWDGYQPDLPLGPPNPFQIFVMSRIDPEVNFDWGSGTPDPNVNVNYFACRWVGHVECPVDANYTFTTRADDGERLFIDGHKLDLIDYSADPAVDAWRQGGMGVGQWRASIVLSAGLHDIEMHQYEREGDAGAELRWSAIPTNPSDDPIPTQIIPAIWLWAPLFASGPRPPDGATVDDRTPMLEWIPGLNADYHELYFSDSFNDVNNRNPAIKEIVFDPCRPYPAVPPLRLATTYYWLVDEVKSSPAERWNARTVWSFTTSECMSLDNMEDYNDRDDIRLVWRDGSADVVWIGSHPYLTLLQGGSSGSNLNVSTAVGSPIQGATGPIPPTPLNYQAMVLLYDNDGFTYIGLPGEERWIYDAPYYSEIEANTVGNNSLNVGQTWDSDGAKSLSLSFQGHPISDGYYDASAWPAYTIYGRGRDIWGRHDEFYFLSQYPFTGAGSIQVQILQMDNTDPWAKAGVMIREKWAPYSKFAAVFMTPGNGVSFQYRDSEDGPCTSITKPGITAPQYLKLERTISGAFEAKHSANGFVWEDVNAPGQAPVLPEISMGTISDPNIYVGTAVTSHNANQACAADFNNVIISPLPPNWIYGNIGTNAAEQLYVALSDGVNTDVVEHNDVNAATLTSWQEWNIPLTDFTTVNLDAIKKVYIGFGDRDVPVQGGSGAIYVDDIRACPPRCVPAFAQMIGDIAQPYDCTVDEKDVRVLAGDWLLTDDFIPATAPGAEGAHYKFENNTNDSASVYHGTAYGSPTYTTGRIDSYAISFDGSDDYVVVQDHPGIEFTGESFSVSLWLKSDYTANPKEFLVCNGTNGTEFTGASGKRYVLKFDSGQLRFLIDDDVTKTNCNIAYDNYATGEWVHVTALCDRDANELRVYRDGLLDATTSNVTTGDINSPAEPLYIGAKQQEGANAASAALAPIDHFFQGPLDDVRIYNYALSDGEIAYLATDGGAGIHLAINSPADLYKGEAPGNQWINFNDYCLIADQYLEKLLWPTP